MGLHRFPIDGVGDTEYVSHSGTFLPAVPAVVSPVVLGRVKFGTKIGRPESSRSHVIAIKQSQVDVREAWGLNPRFLVEEFGSDCAVEYALNEFDETTVLREEAKLG